MRERLLNILLIICTMSLKIVLKSIQETFQTTAKNNENDNSPSQYFGVPWALSGDLLVARFICFGYMVPHSARSMLPATLHGVFSVCVSVPCKTSGSG